MDNKEDDISIHTKEQIAGNEDNIFEQAAKYEKKREKSHYFKNGLLLGIVAAFLVMVIIVVSVAGVCIQKGYIHIGVNGDVYIQSDAVTDGSGIGSEVEAKLNAIDSVLDSFYFDEVDEEKAKNNIYKAYLSSYGDKYTVYYTPEEYKSMMESTSGSFYGIGAVCQKADDGSILISEAYEDAPAYKSGIRNGDKVTEVNGEDITGMDLSVAVALIKGEKGTDVNLTVMRNGEKLSFTVTRDKIDIKTVSSEVLENNIGYIYISQFDDVTTEQFKSAVDDLQKQGITGLVIDIRNNPGGVLKTVADMLDYILPNGLIVYTETKSGKRQEYSGSDNHELNIPMAVLVNGNSASASEIFAGAMQDYDKAQIIGTQTFGKGIVQTIRPLTDGSAVKYTIAKYFTPKGQDIHGKGVTPDSIVELPDDATEDVQLKVAVEYLNGKMSVRAAE